MDRERIIITLFLILTFSIFAHWGGTNSFSKYDLTKAIVDRQQTNIDPYASNTVDKRLYSSQIRQIASRQGHDSLLFSEIKAEMAKNNLTDQVKIYSDKAPLSSFLATPVYFLAHNDLTTESKREQEALSHYASGIDKFLITVLISTMFGVTLLASIYRFGTRFLTKRNSLLLLLLLGLMTPLTYYSTSYFGVITASLLAFTSFRLLYAYLDRKEGAYLVASGLLTGLAIAAEYPTLLLAPFFLLFLVSQPQLKEKRWKLLEYSASVFFGLAPLLLYNLATTGHLLTIMQSLPFGFHSCDFYSICFLTGPQHGMFLLNPARIMNVALRVLFYPVIGLFYYSPVLLAALPGTYYLYRKKRLLALFLVAIFFAFLLFNSSWYNWLAGVSFGPRYLLPSLPFLLVPTLIGLTKLWGKGYIWKLLIITTVFLSFFNTMAGFNSLSLQVPDANEYEVKMRTMQPVKSNFYSRLMQEFQKHGARSEVLMSLAGRDKGFDISYDAPYGPEYFKLGSILGRMLAFRSQLLPIIVVLLLLLPLLPLPTKYRVLLLLVPLVLIVLSVSLKEISFGSGFYGFNAIQDKKWMKKEGKISLYSPQRQNSTIYFEAGLTEEMERSNLVIALNNKVIGNYSLRGRQKIYLPQVRLETGQNKIKLTSSEGCFKSEASGLCKSFLVGDFHLVKAEELPGLLYAEGWSELGDGDRYHQRWLKDEGKLYIKSPTGQGVIHFKAGLTDNLKRSDLLVRVNKELVANYSLKGSQEIYLPQAPIKKEQNIIELVSSAGCVESKSVGCKSFLISNFSLLDQSEAPEVIFYKGWNLLGASSGVGDRWMEDQGSIYFRGKEGKKIVHFKAGLTELMERSQLQVSINDKSVQNYSLRGSQQIYLPRADPKRGWNKLKLKSSLGCKLDAEGEDCHSFLLSNFEQLNQEQLPNLIFGKGFVPQGSGLTFSSGQEELYRSMKRQGTIWIYSPKGGKIKMMLAAQPQTGDALDLKFDFNQDQGRQVTVTDKTSTINLSAKEGWNKLLVTSNRCKNTERGFCISLILQDLKVSFHAGK